MLPALSRALWVRRFAPDSTRTTSETKFGSSLEGRGPISTEDTSWVGADEALGSKVHRAMGVTDRLFP